MFRKLYGKSNEKTPDPNQLSFFNEAETSADPSAPEPTKTEVVKGYNRKQKSIRTDSFGDLPVHKVLCYVNDHVSEVRHVRPAVSYGTGLAAERRPAAPPDHGEVGDHLFTEVLPSCV